MKSNKLKNISLLIFLGILFISSKSWAQYCSAAADDNGIIYISRVVLNTIDNTSSSNYYSDYTSLSTELEIGSTNTLTVTNGNYFANSDLGVWIDFNNDGDFADAQENVICSSNDGASGDYELIIPNNVNSGDYTMRIRTKYYGNNCGDPCGTTTYGEVEDYTVKLIGKGIYATEIEYDKYSSCLDANSNIDVLLQNQNSGSSPSNFNVEFTLENPNGSSSSWTQVYQGTLSDNSTGLITAQNVNLSTYGTYYLTIETQVVGVTNYPITKTLIIEPPKSIPYTESFDGDKDNFWNLGKYLSWNSGQIFGYVNNDKDTLISPAIAISLSDYYFNYNFDYSGLNLGDTILIQYGEACTGNFATIDTIINDGDPLHRGTYNTYYDEWTMGRLLTDNNKNLQFRFVISTNSNVYFDLNEFVILPGNNIRVTDILLDEYWYMPNETYNLSVVVQNIGPKTQSNISVVLNTYGGTTETLTGSYSSPLQYSKKDTIQMGTINTSNPGVYELIAKASVPRDDADEDNLYSETIEIDKVQQNFPIILNSDFNNYDADNDGDDDPIHWTYDNFNSNTNLWSNWVPRGESASLTSFKFGPIPENAFMAFDYRIENMNDAGDYGFGLGNTDIINIDISTDNGNSFKPLAYLDKDNYEVNQNYNDLSTIPSIDLSTYKGTEAIFRIEVANGDSNNDGTSQILFSINNLHIGRADIAVEDISWNFDTWCGEENANFYVDVRNNSYVKAENVPVSLEVTGAHIEDASITVIIPEIPANSSARATLGTYDLSIVDEYQLNAFVSFAGDYNPDNNERDEIVSIEDIEAIPFVESFNPPVAWFYSSSTGVTGHYTTQDALGLNLNDDDSYKYHSMLAYNEFYFLNSVKFGIVEEGNYLSIDYLIKTFDKDENYIGNYLRQDDVVEIHLSDDCGDTWNLAYTITGNNHVDTDNWQNIPNLDLSAYAGKNVRAGFKVIKGNETGYMQFAINTFHIISSGDAGVVEIDVPQYLDDVAVCGQENDQAMVVVKNFGIGTISNVPVVLEAIFEEDTTWHTGITGTILPGETDTIYISGYNSIQAGSYELVAYTELIDDLNNDNNELSGFGLTVQRLHLVPWNYWGDDMPADWQYYTTLEANWSNQVSLHGEGTGFLATPILNEKDTAIVTFQKVGPIGLDYKLRLTYNAFAYDNDGTYLADYFREGDKMEVQISSDCGNSYITIHTFDHQNHEITGDVKTLIYNLDENYLNSEIAVRLVIVKNSNIGQLRVGIDAARVTIPLPELNFDKLQVGNFDEIEVCGKANEPVYAIISNVSALDSITDVTITAEVKAKNQYGEEAVVEILNYYYTDMLYVGETDTILIGNFKSEEVNTYTITTEIIFDGEVNNNERETKLRIWEIADQNYVMDFNDGGWSNDVNINPDAWKYTDNVLGWRENLNLTTQDIFANDTAMIYSPRIGPLKANSSVYFTYDVPGDFSIGDKIDVQVSFDCGATFTSIGNVNNDENIDLSVSPLPGEAVFSIGNTEGDIIIVRYVITNINSDSFIASIDNFDIKTMDIEVLGIVNDIEDFNLATYAPAQNMDRFKTCGSANDRIIVVIKNAGEVDVTNFDINLDYEGTSQGTHSLSYTGILEPGDPAAIMIGSVNTQPVGQLNLVTYIVGAFDKDQSNDTIGFTVTTQNNYTVPYTLNDNDEEANYWEFDNGFALGDSLKAMGLTPEDTATAMGPKITLGNNLNYLYFNYDLTNSIHGTNIIHDEIGEVLISTNCSQTWETIWYTDVNQTTTGNRGVAAVDLSAYAGSSIQLMFRGTKGYSSGGLNVKFYNISILDYSISDVLAIVEGEPVASGTTICEGVEVELSTYGLTGFNYVWELTNSEAIVSLGNTSKIKYTLKDVDSGTITVYAYDANWDLAYQTNWDVSVNPLPTQGIISGHQEVVSNVLFTEYTVQMDNAEQYKWSMDFGGTITGYGSTGIVDWQEGYVGYTEIKVIGMNQCGDGPESDGYMVYVEFLDPPGGENNYGDNFDENFKNGNSNESSLIKTYPNPNNGTFTLQMPEDKDRYIVEIKNNQGIVIQRDFYTNIKSQINLGKRVPGIYFMRIITNDGIYTKRFIIK